MPRIVKIKTKHIAKAHRFETAIDNTLHRAFKTDAFLSELVMVFYGYRPYTFKGMHILESIYVRATNRANLRSLRATNSANLRSLQAANRAFLFALPFETSQDMVPCRIVIYGIPGRISAKS